MMEASEQPSAESKLEEVKAKNMRIARTVLQVLFWPFTLAWWVWHRPNTNGLVKAAATAFCGVGAIMYLIVFAAIVSAPTQPSGQPASQASATATPAIAAAPTATPVPTPAVPHFGNGTLSVGADIQPGTYRTRTSSANCYYARLSGFDGSVEQILANDNTSAPAVVTVAATDKGFKSSGCGTWTQDLSQITASTSSFGDGIFIVGTDILPGTYRTSGQTGCYYARLGGFSGSVGDILANDNTDSAAIVTISASDKGFKSARCGTWDKQ
jgi:hypothetical protein